MISCALSDVARTLCCFRITIQMYGCCKDAVDDARGGATMLSDNSQAAHFADSRSALHNCRAAPPNDIESSASRA
ncbi:hypothetical protein MRB53_037282 [Persea americana]|nr:hypothetical protein MRB53_037282 [Persea americana]